MGLKWNEMIGNVYGDMQVLRRATQAETPWHSHETPLWVKCQQCGQEWIGRKGDIEKKKPCPYCHKIGGRGHYNKELLGKRFGYLTIKAYDKESTASHSGDTYWICQCDCGNVISVRLDHLLGRYRHSPTISCGCATRSSGEINTQYALKDLGLDYKIETIVPECHQWSPFDIEVIDQNGERVCFFECDGEQHFKFVPQFHTSEMDLIHQQEIDNIKTLWCKENHVPLFRIPYTDYTSVNAEYLITRFPEFKKLLESLESRQNQ